MRWSLATVALVPRGATFHADRAERHDVLKWAARTGFEGIEISPQWLNICGLPTSELRRFCSDTRNAGLTVSGINVNRCLFTRGLNAQDQFRRIRRAIDAAAILETRSVTLSLSMPLDDNHRPLLRGCEVPPEERRRAADLLTELAQKANSQGIAISLELHDDGLLDTAEYCLDMVHRVAVNGVGVNPDLGNFARSNPPGSDWRNQLQQLAPLANNWHVKNYRAAVSAPLWDGDIDYREAMRMMCQAGYDGWVSIESYSADARDLQERSLAYLRQLEHEQLDGKQGAAA